MMSFLTMLTCFMKQFLNAIENQHCVWSIARCWPPRLGRHGGNWTGWVGFSLLCWKLFLFMFELGGVRLANSYAFFKTRSLVSCSLCLYVIHCLAPPALTLPRHACAACEFSSLHTVKWSYKTLYFLWVSLTPLTSCFGPSGAVVGGRGIRCPTKLAYGFEPPLPMGVEATLTTRALRLTSYKSIQLFLNRFRLGIRPKSQ